MMQDSVNFNTINNNVNIDIIFNANDILVLDNVLSNNECEQIITKNLIEPDDDSSQSKRKRKRIEFPDLSTIIEERCYKYLPKLLFQSDPAIDGIYGHDNNNQYWNYIGIHNNRKIHKRKIGDKLDLHYDSICVNSVDHKSMYTILIYLNDCDGDIKFKEYQVSSKMGRVVIMNKLHEGLENKNVIKIYIRSKLMYERVLKMEKENDRKAAEIYSETIVKYGKLSTEYDLMLDEVFQ